MSEIERIKELYKDNNREDYNLNSVMDLQMIHGIDFEGLKGVHDFSSEVWRTLIEGFIVNFFNKYDLEARMNIEPISFEYIDDNKPYVKFEYKYYDEDTWLHVRSTTEWY